MNNAQNTAMPPATAAEIANEFLSLAVDDGLQSTMDQMKLQKLTFYAHAWYLAYNNRPLIENDFEAWPWGPVVRSIYVQTKGFGDRPVDTLLSEFKQSETGFSQVFPTGVSDDLKPFIKNVWDVLKSLSGIQLSNSTHAQGEPWTIVNEQQGTDQKPVISNSLIANIFKKKLEAGD